ncbi:MAG: hypothetical protein EOP34_04105 [Rickettsiales bacterium]|nr:MAG: hypothetical protein EOP34_04105 [Rickettsiales bacterium]
MSIQFNKDFDINIIKVVHIHNENDISKEKIYPSDIPIMIYQTRNNIQKFCRIYNDKLKSWDSIIYKFEKILNQGDNIIIIDEDKGLYRIHIYEKKTLECRNVITTECVLNKNNRFYTVGLYICLVNNESISTVNSRTGNMTQYNLGKNNTLIGVIVKDDSMIIWTRFYCFHVNFKEDDIEKKENMQLYKLRNSIQINHKCICYDENILVVLIVERNVTGEATIFLRSYNCYGLLWDEIKPNNIKRNYKYVRPVEFVASMQYSSYTDYINEVLLMNIPSENNDLVRHNGFLLNLLPKIENLIDNFQTNYHISDIRTKDNGSISINSKCINQNTNEIKNMLILGEIITDKYYLNHIPMICNMVLDNYKPIHNVDPYICCYNGTVYAFLMDECVSDTVIHISILMLNEKDMTFYFLRSFSLDITLSYFLNHNIKTVYKNINEYLFIQIHHKKIYILNLKMKIMHKIDVENNTILDDLVVVDRIINKSICTQNIVIYMKSLDRTTLDGIDCVDMYDVRLGSYSSILLKDTYIRNNLKKIVQKNTIWYYDKSIETLYKESIINPSRIIEKVTAVCNDRDSFYVYTLGMIWLIKENDEDDIISIGPNQSWQEMGEHIQLNVTKKDLIDGTSVYNIIVYGTKGYICWITNLELSPNVYFFEIPFDSVPFMVDPCYDTNFKISKICFFDKNRVWLSHKPSSDILHHFPNTIKSALPFKYNNNLFILVPCKSDCFSISNSVISLCPLY